MHKNGIFFLAHFFSVYDPAVSHIGAKGHFSFWRAVKFFTSPALRVDDIDIIKSLVDIRTEFNAAAVFRCCCLDLMQKLMVEFVAGRISDPQVMTELRSSESEAIWNRHR